MITKIIFIAKTCKIYYIKFVCLVFIFNKSDLATDYSLLLVFCGLLFTKMCIFVHNVEMVII